jgi:hypothetical protein
MAGKPQRKISHWETYGQYNNIKMDVRDII